MYLLGFVCLLSVAVALPPPEQLHTNLPAQQSSAEVKSSENSKSSEKLVPEALNSDESKKPLQSVEQPEVEKEDDKDKPDDIKKVIEEVKSSEKPKDSKESMESKKPAEWGSKEWENSKEPNESKKPAEWGSKEWENSKEPNESNEPKYPIQESGEFQEDKKDSRPLESKEDIKSEEDDKPILVQVVSKKPFWSGLLPSFNFPHWSSIQWPFNWPSFIGRPQFRGEEPIPDQPMRDESMSDRFVPILVIKESDLDFD